MTLALLPMGAGFVPVQIAPDVAQITSDTAEYCAQLAAQLESAPIPEEARLLHDQGVRLCAGGKLQAGIVRLRRALLIRRQAQRR